MKHMFKLNEEVFKKALDNNVPETLTKLKLRELTEPKLNKKREYLVKDIQHQVTYMSDINKFDVDYFLNTVNEFKRVNEQLKQK